MKFNNLKVFSLFLLVNCCFVETQGFAATSFLSVAKDFTFGEKPIHPQCLDFGLGTPNYEPIYLETAKCQNESKPLESKYLKDGLVGSDLLEGGYLAYKPLGKIHFADLEDPTYELLYVQMSGGGTGAFTSLVAVEKTDTTLRYLDTLEGGDRCNGGISDPVFNEEDQSLTYKVNVTPLSLYSLTQEETPKDLKFADCASCCLGKLSYEDSDITQFNFNKDVSSLGEKGSPQACYDQVIKETMASGKATLTPEELIKFGDEVKKRCLSKSHS